jgi:hypothetical protein
MNKEVRDEGLVLALRGLRDVTAALANITYDEGLYDLHSELTSFIVGNELEEEL